MEEMFEAAIVTHLTTSEPISPQNRSVVITAVEKDHDECPSLVDRTTMVSEY